MKSKSSEMRIFAPNVAGLFSRSLSTFYKSSVSCCLLNIMSKWLKCTLQQRILQLSGFYPRDAMLARVIVIATCLSVRLSRASIVSKRRKLAAWFLHHLIAPRL